MKTKKMNLKAIVLSLGLVANDDSGQRNGAKNHRKTWRNVWPQ